MSTFEDGTRITTVHGRFAVFHESWGLLDSFQCRADSEAFAKRYANREHEPIQIEDRMARRNQVRLWTVNPESQPDASDD